MFFHANLQQPICQQKRYIGERKMDDHAQDVCGRFPPDTRFFFFTRGCCGQWRISISDRKTDAYVFWILISHCVSVTAVLLFIGYSPSCRSRSCSRLTTGRKVVYALKEDFCRAHCSFHAHMEGKSKLYRSRMQIERLVLQTVYTNWTD